MRGEQGRGSSDAVGSFRRRLADLKRNGCNVLLVGTDSSNAACERLLGESSAGPRYRLFVTTDATPAAARAKRAEIASGRYGDASAVVDWRTGVRCGTEVRDGDSREEDERTDPRLVAVESDDLRDLGVAIETEIERFDDEAGGLSAAELRLCFDSLDPVAAEHEPRDVRRFVLGVTETVERYRGMGHYHLDAAYDSETVDQIESLFDAVIETRVASAQCESAGESDRPPAAECEQRWHLTDPDVTTDWLAL